MNVMAHTRQKGPIKTVAQARAVSVAQEVKKQVLAGKGVRVGPIARKHGYSESSIRAGKVQRTVAFKTVVLPVLDQLAAARQRALNRLPKAEKKAGYRDLVEGIHKLTHNHQLLSGLATDNVAIGIRKLSDAELQDLAAKGRAELPSPP